MEEERETIVAMAKRCMELEKENRDLKRKLSRRERELDERDSLIAEARAERDEVAVKYRGRFGKVREHLGALRETRKVDLMLCQATGTLECLEIARGEYGMVVPADLLDILEGSKAEYTTELEGLPKVDFCDAELLMMPSGSPGMSLQTDFLLDDVLGIDQLNIGDADLDADVETRTEDAPEGHAKEARNPDESAPSA